MKTRYILFAFAALVVSAACSKTFEQPEPEGIQMTFTAYQEGAQGTKTTVQDGGTRVYWEPADEIKVFFKGTGGRFVSLNSSLADVADFTGTMSIAVGANEGASSSNLTWGLYPYRADATSDGSSVTTTLPAEQTGRAGSFAKNTHITLAKSGGYDLGFYNVTGGLRFSLTQDGIKSVTFEGQNNEAVAGTFKASFSGGVPVVQQVSDPQTKITLTAPGGGTFQKGQWYYIAALPGTLSNGFKMTFYKESQSAKLTSSSSVTIKRGAFGSLADADDGLVFKDTGSGGNPDPSGVIQFADPIAKYACVEKFDTNGDGEVSYAEAAAATSLSGLFTNWNTVTSFDEIKYFTSVSSTEGVFDGCSKLESITIPDNITTLGSFQNCTSLKKVILPDGLASLPAFCFDGCSMLIEIAIPPRITIIPFACFRGCAALPSIELPSVLKTIGDYAFQNCSGLTAVAFPSSLTYIGSYAFSGSGLTTASISNASIGKSAFSDCTALISVTLPSGMTSIPSRLFYKCKSLASIVWPDNVSSIESQAFYGCRFKAADRKLELPSSVTSIGSKAFYRVRHLIVPSTSAVSIASDSFEEGYTLLYVPAGMLNMYKLRTNWSTYVGNIYPIGDYPVELFILPVSEAVDLGLSVKWASWNLGASAPEKYGYYYTWGEEDINPWQRYEWQCYEWCYGADNKLTKYCTDSSYWVGSSSMDNKTVLDPDDDAAHVNWGGSWRMPTDAEWTELRTNCTWTRTTQNGVNGRLVTGPNGNSIFLPAAGYWKGTDLKLAVAYGFYWSSSLGTNDQSRAWSVFFDSDRVYRGNDYRYYGLSVRPVTE